MPQQGCGDNRERLEIRGVRGKCRREDKRVSGFIFGTVRNPARSGIGSQSRRGVQDMAQIAASQMTLVGSLRHPKAFARFTWGNQDEKDSDSVG